MYLTQIFLILELITKTDKVADGDSTVAKEKFQQIAFAYAILSDPRRRERYDTTGSTAEVLLNDDDDFNWIDFYRSQFEEITTESIESFKNSYKESEDEREDLLRAYTRFNGRMNKVYQTVILSNPLDDEDRFQKIFQEAIESGEIEPYDAFTKEPAKSKKQRIDNAKREAADAEEESRKITKGNGKRAKKGKDDDGTGDLLAMIQQNQRKRGAFLDNLEAKYAAGNGTKAKGKKRGRPHEEPPDEAFEAVGARSKKAKAKR